MAGGKFLRPESRRAGRKRRRRLLRVGVWPESCSLATVFLRFPNPSGPAWKKLSKREQQQLTAWAQHPGMTNVVWRGISTDLTVREPV